MKKILVVEDDSLVRTIMTTTLNNGVYTILSANNGVEAESVLAQETVDLVVTDIFMPERDGLKTIELIREKHPQLKVIAVTGGGPFPDQAELMLDLAQGFGADKVLRKPFPPTSLRDAVKELIG